MSVWFYKNHIQNYFKIWKPNELCDAETVFTGSASGRGDPRD